MSERFWAVVPAAGAGRRMASERPKQYLELNGRCVIDHTLDRLLGHPQIEAVYLALSTLDEWWPVTQFAEDQLVVRVAGGAERCHSVLNALNALSKVAEPQDWVLVHDAARPCLRREDLDRLINSLKNDAVGGLLGIPVHDTVKQVDSTGHIERTVPRDPLWRAYTPQMFRLQPLRDALTQALQNNQTVTDDASAMELAGYRPRMIEGSPDNIKITQPADLALAGFYLAQHSITGQ